MPRPAKGNHLQEAIALLIQNQATFLSHIMESYNRLSRIEGELEQIKAILLRHERTLTELPEAIRQKIGFKAPR